MTHKLRCCDGANNYQTKKLNQLLNMKKNLIFICLMLASLAASAQDAKAILKKSFERCQSVQNGYYEMDEYMKFMSGMDTSKTSFNCYFKKLDNDSIYGSSFHYQEFRKGEYVGDVLYTGDDFVTAYIKDSIATIQSKTLWAEDMKSAAHDYTFYSPLTEKESYPLPMDSAYTHDRYTFKFAGEETVGKFLCYHIQVNLKPQNDSEGMMKILKIEQHFWVNKADYIPVQFSNTFEAAVNKDTMYQYQLNVLTKYEINNLKDENILTLNSIPAYFKVKDYVPFTTAEPLKDTLAPNWELPSLNNEKISLNSLQGQVVLVDFFYKACYPCMQALPALQALHEKYKDKGLKVIGIDPYDKKADDLTSFLSKRSVTYTVLLGDKNVETDY
jgi:thiol-disulfide isomerase/thioredoxin